MAERFSFERIDHVQPAIPAGGEDKCRAFRGDVLGLPELPKPPLLAARGGCWFDASGFQVHVGVEQDFRPALEAHPVFRIRGIRALAERLLAAGHPVVWAEDVPGRDRFHTDDPFGNRLEFLELR